jgi:alpha-beta hydrolase superfamily lysophospholipase
MSSDSTKPDTIVLIHGFWVTPQSWEHWIPHYEARGYRVLAPGTSGSSTSAGRRPSSRSAGGDC